MRICAHDSTFRLSSINDKYHTCVWTVTRTRLSSTLCTIPRFWLRDNTFRYIAVKLEPFGAVNFLLLLTILRSFEQPLDVGYLDLHLVTPPDGRQYSLCCVVAEGSVSPIA